MEKPSVTALLKYMTPNQNMYKNHSLVEGKTMLNVPWALGAVHTPGSLIKVLWDDHIIDFQTDEVKEVMRAEGGRNNKVHSEMQTPDLFTKVEGVCKEYD
eukprot:3566244-Ditylum_brightwellii.AAC.1